MEIITHPNPPKLTPQEYLAWEADQPLRYEYLNGVAIAMTGGTLLYEDVELSL